MFIRDKFGQSAYGKLVVAELAVPHPMVIVVGSMLASAGAGMQCLIGAPRLLRAIAQDGVIPILEPFKATRKNGEPWLATLLSIALCEFGILIAQLESITALISQFFLMCYLSVNAACFLQGFLKAPNWRPRFRFYHWLFSLFGALLCVAVMFMSHWGFAILSVVIGVIAYKYIEYQGAEKEWGDGMSGLSLSAAMYSLLKLEHGPIHTKNWSIQTSGLGSLKHNTLVIGWPMKWKQSENVNDCRMFVEAVRVSLAASCAVVVTKNCDSFPNGKSKVSYCFIVFPT
ncbi:unnamed protein product [Soboliphyme baturini]|uniref:AA_permease domain-containing protein n=1 Tax=Soboliphyme baturini TaxID=241478 RepID=A0A183IPM8_9BILA|nr:unnamed protein product [Soboliphyme baturini]